MILISKVDAIERGLKRYFTGLPCRKCGKCAERLVSNSVCLICKRRGRQLMRMKGSNVGVGVAYDAQKSINQSKKGD